jgi:DNA-binding transcriptional MerR regulator
MQNLWEIANKQVGAEVIRAFTADHVVRLTGLSQAQLRYWDRTGFFKPAYGDSPGAPYGRVYSFRDVVGLRTLSVLRKSHEIPLQQLRKIARQLSRHTEVPWSELTLYVFRGEVYFREPDTEAVRGVLSGQYTHIRLRRIIQDIAAEAEKLKHRTPDQIGRIERNRYIVHRAWVVAGTRIPTKAIWNFAQAGYSPKGIIREYPLLTEQDIDEALAHEEKLISSRA